MTTKQEIKEAKEAIMEVLGDTLVRDLFAAIALHAYVSRPWSHEEMAFEAYRLADAMLKEREK